MHRVAEAVGASQVYLKRYTKGRAAQQWIFNNKDKMVRSNHWKKYCMEIPGNGGQNELRMTSTCDSRWWRMFKFQITGGNKSGSSGKSSGGDCYQVFYHNNKGATGVAGP
jgi:hypothetical protein